MSLPPDEQAALRRATRPWTRGLWSMVIALALVAATLVFLAARDPGLVEHALGASTEETAVVASVDEVEWCSRRNGDVYTLEWEQDGHARSGQVERCGDPWQVGDEVDIWATGGQPQTSPPVALWASFGFLVLAFAAGMALVVRAGTRVRAQTHAALDGTWQPGRLPTRGQPGIAGFHAEGLRHRRRDWTRVIHDSPGRPDQPQVPGTLFVDHVRRGRPKGLSLHTTADGRRTWRWHGV